MKERFCDSCYYRLATIFDLITFEAICLDCYLDQHFALAIGETKMSKFSKFQVKVKNNYLSVTHNNGQNWSSIRLDRRQMEAVAKELQSYVKSLVAADGLEKELADFNAPE